MRLPIPTNRLVALTLLGAVLTTLLAAGLTAPSIFPGTDPTADPAQSGTLSADAPTPNPDFTPAIQRAPGGEEHEEWEHDDDDEWEEDDEGDDEDETHDD